MKNYFMKLELNQPKNRAQKEAQNFAKVYADCLIDEPGLNQFKEDFNLLITGINKKFPHCGDIAPVRQSNQWRDPDELEIRVDAGITFLVRSVKRVEFSSLSGKELITKAFDFLHELKGE